MRLVVDASVTLKWYLSHRDAEQEVEQAAAVGRVIESGTTQLFAPPHWILEVVSVLARIEPDLVDTAILEMSDMKPTLIESSTVLSRAAQMATNLQRHMFDTLYHAVALDCDATLVTADAQYYNASQHLGHIVSLTDFRPL